MKELSPLLQKDYSFKSFINLPYSPFTQIAATLSVSIAWMQLGVTIGYATTAVPQLTIPATNISTFIQLQNQTNITNESYEYKTLKDDNFTTIEEKELYISDDSGSWFAAAFFLCGIFMSPFGGWLGGMIGRRKLILLSAPLVIVGFCLIGTAKNLEMLFIGRTLSCVGVALHIGMPGVYIAETVHPKLRSSLIIIPDLFLAIGTLSAWVIGYFLDWRNTAFVEMIPSALLIITMIFFPESPYWLIEAGKMDLARKSLQFFRGADYDITQEISEIIEKNESKIEQNKGKSASGPQYLFRRMKSRAFFKPFSIIGVLFALQEANGVNSMLVYLVQILEMSGSTVEPKFGTILAGVCRLVTAAILPFFMSRFNPKYLFVFCQIISTSCFGFIGTFAYLQRIYPESETLQYFGWIPLASITVQIIMRSGGILPVMNTLMNELFPTEIRTSSIGICQCLTLTCGFVTIKVFQDLIKLISLSGVCIIYGSIGVIAIIWAATFIPDNRGKSLVKIEALQSTVKIALATVNQISSESNEVKAFK